MMICSLNLEFGAVRCFARAMLRRGFFVQIFWVVFRCVFSTWNSKCAKECKSCRSRKKLNNAPTLALDGVDRAENKASKVGDGVPTLGTAISWLAALRVVVSEPEGYGPSTYQIAESGCRPSGAAS